MVSTKTAERSGKVIEQSHPLSAPDGVQHRTKSRLPEEEGIYFHRLRRPKVVPTPLVQSQRPQDTKTNLNLGIVPHRNAAPDAPLDRAHLYSYPAGFRHQLLLQTNAFCDWQDETVVMMSRMYKVEQCSTERYEIKSRSANTSVALYISGRGSSSRPWSTMSGSDSAAVILDGNTLA